MPSLVTKRAIELYKSVLHRYQVKSKSKPECPYLPSPFHFIHSVLNIDLGLGTIHYMISISCNISFGLRPRDIVTFHGIAALYSMRSNKSRYIAGMY